MQSLKSGTEQYKDLQVISRIIERELDLHDARRARVNARQKRMARKVQRDGRIERVDAKVERVAPGLDGTKTTLDRVKSEILSELNRSLDIRFEAISQMIDIFGDGVAYLFERLDAIERRLERLEARVDYLSVEILAHRLDPEAHHRTSGYRIIEDKTVHDEEKKPN